jgi:hypothetical protein
MKDVKDGGKPHVLTSSFSLHPSAFQIWGARAALGGVFAAVPIGWLVTRTRPDAPSAWYAAGWVYALVALLFLGLGAFIAGWPELIRRGAMAERFAAAEWRHLRARSQLAGRILWWLVALAGWAILAALAAQLLAAMHGGYYYGASYHFRPLRWSGLLLWMSGGGLVFSLFLPMVVAASAAANLSSSRRSGAAEHLLMGPFAADLLGWAAVGAQARRAVRVLLLAMPYYLAPGLLLADELVRSELLGPAELETALLVVGPVLALGLLLEMLMIRRAAALGAWLGAVISRPGIAAGLAAMGGAGFWFLRPILVMLSAYLAVECHYALGDELAMAAGAACFLAAELALFAALTPLLLWLARSALAAPLGLRLGQWLQRLGSRLAVWGERIEGGDQRSAGRRRIFLLPDGSWGRGPLGWKTTMAAAVLAAFGLTCAFPLVGDFCVRQSPETANWVLGALVVVAAWLLLAVRFLAVRVAKFLRASAGSEESGK